MKRTVWITVLAVVAFLAMIIARLPASWVIPSSSKTSCTSVGGTVWDGVCNGLVAQGQAIGDISWELHGSALLTGKVIAAVMLARPGGTARANLEYGFDRHLIARDVKADLPLDPSLLPQLPANLHGRLRADLDLLRVDKRAVREVRGVIEALDLQEGPPGQSSPFGSYSITFPGGGGNPLGRLRDLGGPLSVEGSLKLTPEPGFELRTLVAARPGAPVDLEQQLRYLGSPDAQGRRPFDMTATF